MDVVLSHRAERDLRRIGRGEAIDRIREVLTALADSESSLDIKPLAGVEPWLRLRAGDYRIIYRPIDSTETNDAGARWLVARIVHLFDGYFLNVPCPYPKKKAPPKEPK